LSLERVIEALTGLGLTRRDAELYVYLAKKGPLKLIELNKCCDFSKVQTSKSINNLKKMGLVTEEHSKFSTITFESALEMLIKKQKQKEDLLVTVKEKIKQIGKAKEMS
jgi:predicted transcriptional regulator